MVRRLPPPNKFGGYDDEAGLRRLKTESGQSAKADFVTLAPHFNGAGNVPQGEAVRDRVPKTCTYLFVHFVWATWDREPFITPDVETDLHACIAGQCRELKCVPLSVNGMSEHIHVLAQMHAAVSVAELAQRMKGGSSHLMTHVLAPGQPFKWQGSYGAFSLSRNHVERVEAYIARQKRHHARSTLWDDWEQCGTFLDDEINV